jgi:hypothetical protein
MAATITWSIDTHRKETSGKNYVDSVSWIVIASEGGLSNSETGNIILSRPSDSDMKDYDTFMGSGDTNLLAAVKAQLGSTEITAKESAVKAKLERAANPTHQWVDGPKAA